MRLSDLADAVDLPETSAAERAWDLARSRIRRRRLAVVASASVALLAVIAVPLVRGGHEETGSPAAPPSSSPSPSPSPSARVGSTSGVVPDELITPSLEPDEYAALAAEVPRLEVTDSVPLSEDPVRRAVLAVVPSGLRGDAGWSTIAVLGDDGGWRSVDVEGLVPTHDAGGYQSYALSPTSLNVDGTRLAMAQPSALVVVDLTDGTSRRYDVAGPNQAAVWRDDTHVLVSVEERPMMREVDLGSGEVTDTNADASTRFLPGGRWVAWPRHGHLTTSDGSSSAPAGINNSAGLEQTVPLADRDLVVGLTTFARRTGGGIHHGNLGAAVVDHRSGELLGVRAASNPATADACLLLGLDDHSVLMSVVSPSSAERLLLRWNWRERSTDVVAVVAAGMMSWPGPVSDVTTIVD